jgi:hypothetical protein
MTGRDLKELREALGLDQFQFAIVLGCHVSSVYRWEAAVGNISFDATVSRVLQPLRDLLVGKPRLATQLGDDVRSAMVSYGSATGHGGLAGLRVLIDFVLERKP